MPLFITLFSIIVIAAGFAVLHFANLRHTIELRLSGWTLVIGGIVVIFCAHYFQPVPPFSPYHDMGSWRMHKKECKGKKNADGEEKLQLEAPPPPGSKPKK